MHTNDLRLVKSLLWNLIEGETEGKSRKEYREFILEHFRAKLEKAYCNEHFYLEDMKIDYHNTGYIGKIKANNHVFYFYGDHVTIDGFKLEF